MESLDSTPRKYILGQILGNVSQKNHLKVLKYLAKITGKCDNTIKNYAKIPIDGKAEIPYGTAIILEEFFELPPRGLCTTQINCISMKAWLNEVA